MEKNQIFLTKFHNITNYSNLNKQLKLAETRHENSIADGHDSRKLWQYVNKKKFIEIIKVDGENILSK